MITTWLLVVLLLVVAALAVIIIINHNKITSVLSQRDDTKSLLLLQQNIAEVNRTVDARLTESTQLLQRQFGQSTAIIRDVTERLTKLDETNRQVVDFADQLQHLQDILQNPKQRGILGEYLLETVLQNVFAPKQYQMQYKFSDGEIVDAVIFLQDKILPIDSKFSLENYNRIVGERDPQRREALEKEFKSDLKKRIDETAKYIRPQEKTMDFAFMFIPSEGIFYDLLINQVGAIKLSTRDLIDYAFKEKRVIIVSPTSFFAYLQTVLQGLRALKIEESAKEIQQRVGDLGRHILNYESFFKKLGNNLGTTVGAFNDAYEEFRKIDKDVARINGGEAVVQVQRLDKPRLDS